MYCIIQAFKLDKLVSLLPLPVMIGFCNGLAVVIGRAQLHPFHAPRCGEVASDASTTGHGRRLATGACTASGYKEGAELGFMILIMLSAMAVMEFVPKIPKPKDVHAKPFFVRPFSYIALALLTMPSSMLAIGVAIGLEFGLIRPLGYHTATISDVEKFTADDAFP